MGYYPFFEPTRRLPGNGIQARGQRGPIGQTWWSQRFVEVLESFHMGARLTRGRSYARSGQVLDLSIEPRTVTASVQGSRARPYEVSIQLRPLTEKQWGRLERAMTERALLMAKLLAGEMPLEIEGAFETCNLSLFPGSRRALMTRCSCPDWENPCKHLAAAFYILAEMFDDDPFLIFLWRGRSKQELISRLRKRRAGTRPRSKREQSLARVTAKPLTDHLQDFWVAGADLSGLHVDPVAAIAPAALLDELGPLPDAAGGASLTDMLALAYEKIALSAERRAWGGPA
jgi:uncharacterized Zn finger protein